MPLTKASKILILDITPEEKLQKVLREDVIPKTILDEAGCQFIESVLYLFEEEYPNDKSVRNAIEARRKFMAGKITREELNKVKYKVWSVRDDFDAYVISEKDSASLWVARSIAQSTVKSIEDVSYDITPREAAKKAAKESASVCVTKSAASMSESSEDAIVIANLAVEAVATAAWSNVPKEFNLVEAKEWQEDAAIAETIRQVQIIKHLIEGQNVRN